MIIGGWPNHRSVLTFNPQDNSFTQGPNLLYDRYGHGCTLYNSPMHGNRPVVLAVSGVAWRNADTAEVLDYTNTNVWEESK